MSHVTFLWSPPTSRQHQGESRPILSGCQDNFLWHLTDWLLGFSIFLPQRMHRPDSHTAEEYARLYVPFLSGVDAEPPLQPRAVRDHWLLVCSSKICNYSPPLECATCPMSHIIWLLAFQGKWKCFACIAPTPPPNLISPPSHISSLTNCILTVMAPLTSWTLPTPPCTCSPIEHSRGTCTHFHPSRYWQKYTCQCQNHCHYPLCNM